MDVGDDQVQALAEAWDRPAGAAAGDVNASRSNSTRANVDFFLLDVRYYRTPNKEPDGPAKTLLGKRLVTHQTGPKGKQVGRLYMDYCDANATGAQPTRSAAVTESPLANKVTSCPS